MVKLGSKKYQQTHNASMTRIPFIHVEDVERLTRMQRGTLFIRSTSVDRSPSGDSYAMNWLATTFPQVDWRGLPETSIDYVRRESHSWKP